MRRLHAHVQGGRLVLDVATQLPEGLVVELVVADDGDDLDVLDDDERAARQAALAEGWASARAGRTRPAEELLDELRATKK